ncbi:response regulator [Leifsonia sp. NPDC056665]|uniref:response regulator n=1 Tax=Leifsonia sp. NPDC056665 TaxID=3345901 RepID=UPI00369865BA
MTDRRITVLIVDDDTMAANGLTALLGAAPDLEVIGRCSDGDEVAVAVAMHRPDVILCDVRMPRMDGVAVVRAFRGTGPVFLMMTAFDEDGRVLDAVAAGAAGFMLKDEDPHRILDAVRQVAAGDAAFSPRAAKQLASWVRSSRAADAKRDATAKMALLTDREREFALAVMDGASDADLAQRFFVAETTVKSTLSGIRTKWGVRTRTELAVVVARSGA